MKNLWQGLFQYIIILLTLLIILFTLKIFFSFGTSWTPQGDTPFSLTETLNDDLGFILFSGLLIASLLFLFSNKNRLPLIIINGILLSLLFFLLPQPSARETKQTLIQGEINPLTKDKYVYVLEKREPTVFDVIYLDCIKNGPGMDLFQKTTLTANQTLLFSTGKEIKNPTIHPLTDSLFTVPPQLEELRNSFSLLYRYSHRIRQLNPLLTIPLILFFLMLTFTGRNFTRATSWPLLNTALLLFFFRSFLFLPELLLNRFLSSYPLFFEESFLITLVPFFLLFLFLLPFFLFEISSSRKAS